MDAKDTRNTVYIPPLSTQHPEAKPAEYYRPPPPPPNDFHPPTQEGSFDLNHKDKPQANSVGAAALIFTTGGMSIAWGFITHQYTIQPFIMTTYMTLCWFIMAIVGALCSAVLTNMIQKKILMYMSILLVLLGGILCVVLHDSYGGILAARHINGFAVGWIFVTILVVAGEGSVKEWRGVLTSSTEALCFNLGIMVEIIYGVLWTAYLNKDLHANQMHGILIIIFSALALIITYFLFIESPVYFLVRNEEQAAVESLRRLQRPFVITSQTYVLLDELKRYVAENQVNSLGQQITESLPALLKLCIHRSMIGLSNSSVVSFGLIVAAIYYGNIFEIAKWPFIMYGVCRFIGVFVSMCMIDHLGRKKPLMFSMLVAGGITIGIGVLFGDKFNFLVNSKMETALILICVYQIFAGMSIPSSSTYLTEAFPLKLKPYWIALSFSMEMLMYIICIAVDTDAFSLAKYFYALAVLSFLFVVFAYLCLPETRRLTLREAQAKFKGILSTGFQ